jgi:hypothetical protein
MTTRACSPTSAGLAAMLPLMGFDKEAVQKNENANALYKKGKFQAFCSVYIIRI